MAITLNTISTLEKLSLINSNFQKIEDALNQSLVWKTGSVAGETTLTRDLDLNGNDLLNAMVGEFSLSNLATDLQTAVDTAEASATSSSVSAANSQASSVSSSNSATAASNSAIASAASAVTATNAANSVSASAAQITTNTNNISSLTTRMSAEETKVQPIALGGTGNTAGLAATATALATARTIQTNLASATAATFNGTANASPGVTGTLPVANGGTGQVTLAALSTAMGFAYNANSFTIPIGGTNYYIKTGTAIVTTDASAQATVTFGSAFPTSAISCVIVSGDDGNNSVNGTMKLVGWATSSVTGFTFISVAQPSVTKRVNYLAIGV